MYRQQAPLRKKKEKTALCFYFSRWIILKNENFVCSIVSTHCYSTNLQPPFQTLNSITTTQTHHAQFHDRQTSTETKIISLFTALFQR